MAPPRPTSFQSLILTLQSYWAEQGCVILQPFDMEMGAGTFHPATTLRALGPEPWNAAYVQPSRRPTDGRFLETLGTYNPKAKPAVVNLNEERIGYWLAVGAQPAGELGFTVAAGVRARDPVAVLLHLVQVEKVQAHDCSLHSPRLKNSRLPRIAAIRCNNKSKSAGVSTKFRCSEFTISTGAPSY